MVQGGSYYHVNQSGEIFLVQENNDSFDRLTAFNGNSIDVGLDMLDLFTTGSGTFHGTVNISNLFDFLSQNTDVEWAMTRYRNEKNVPCYYLKTDHDTMNVSGCIPRFGTDIVVTHNHPDIPDGLLEPSPQDLEASRQQPNVIFEIRGKNRIVRYQNGAIIND